ncbi:MAG: 50S ribosomal protein L6 [Gammaproteobacteria bacterium]|nr:50S ribosomal protein L6 [Gammaproteobacteria bacterium]
MSRVADNPIKIPQGINVSINGSEITVKGSKSSSSYIVPQRITINQQENMLRLVYSADNKAINMMAGTVRALVNNMLIGHSQGFEKKLVLIGVGYRAKLQGRKVHLTLGFSHPVNFEIPEGVVIEIPSQTEITVKGSDKQLVGQVSANIRAFRPPEPYKGKGIRYVNEQIVRKEAKKK